MARTLLQDVDLVLGSAWYRAWALLHPVDAKKIRLERAGQRRPIAGNSWARCFIEAVRVALQWTPPPPPDPPPPPPPPTYKKVAPRTAHKEGTSDARYCVHNQPGVGFNRDTGRWHDDVASYDDNGLCWGGRTDGDPAVGTVGAKSMDGRSPCELPTFGDPTRNTGSWAI